MGLPGWLLLWGEKDGGVTARPYQPRGWHGGLWAPLESMGADMDATLRAYQPRGKPFQPQEAYPPHLGQPHLLARSGCPVHQGIHQPGVQSGCAQSVEDWGGGCVRSLQTHGPELGSTLPLQTELQGLGGRSWLPLCEPG